MASFKKMRLVPISDDEIKGLKEFVGASNISQSPNLKEASNLDYEIKSILDSSETDRIKAILYSNALRKFLTYKDKFEAESVAKSQQFSDIVENAAQKIIPEIANLIQAQISVPIPKRKSRKQKSVVSKVPKIPQAAEIPLTPIFKTSSPISSIKKQKKSRKNLNTDFQATGSPISPMDEIFEGIKKNNSRFMKNQFPDPEYYPTDFDTSELIDKTLIPKQSSNLDSSINKQFEEFNKSLRDLKLKVFSGINDPTSALASGTTERRIPPKRSAKTIAIKKSKEIAEDLQRGSGIIWESWK